MKVKFSAYKRVVVKLGSSLLVDEKTGLRGEWFQSLLEDIIELKKTGQDILVVSSGAIALGRAILRLPSGPLKLEESQAAASAGQIALAGAFSSRLVKHGICAGQILLTYGDTEERRRYLNARATIETLLALGAIPIINENDAVATSEIRYGDNDRLAARVAIMAGADLLVLLSDVDGLHNAPPNQNSQTKLIEYVPRITPEIEAMAGDVGSDLSRGGMVTKIMAAKIAVENGSCTVIASGKRMRPLRCLDEGAPHTFFQAIGTPRNARKKWIAGHLKIMGRLTIDDGAKVALKNGKSLLPAGVCRIEGSFSRGDAVIIVEADGKTLGQGIVAFDFRQAQKIIGRRSADIEKILGYAGRSEMIRRDDMILRSSNEDA